TARSSFGGAKKEPRGSVDGCRSQRSSTVGLSNKDGARAICWFEAASSMRRSRRVRGSPRRAERDAPRRGGITVGWDARSRSPGSAERDDAGGISPSRSFFMNDSAAAEDAPASGNCLVFAGRCWLLRVNRRASAGNRCAPALTSAAPVVFIASAAGGLVRSLALSAFWLADKD